MARDWMQYADNEAGQIPAAKDWSQYAEEGQSPSDDKRQQLRSELGVKNGMPSFAERAENFYRRTGVHGANRGFAKIFGFGPHQQETENKYQQALETHPAANKLGNFGAQAFSSVPAFMAGGMGAKQLAPHASAYLQSILGGALGGGGLGALETPEEDESRLSNTLWGAGLGSAGAALFPGAKEIPSKIANAPKKTADFAKSLSQEQAVKDAFNKLVTSEAKFKKGYSEILEPKDALPRITWKPSSDDIKTINEISPKYSRNLIKFLDTGAPLDAHWAATDLGSLSAKLGGKTTLNGDERAVKLAADKMKQIVESKIDKVLSTRPGAKEAYRNLDAEFIKEMAPISKDIKLGLKKYGKNKIGAQDVLRRMQGPGAEEYRHAFGKDLKGIKNAKYPETWKNVLAQVPASSSIFKFLGREVSK